MILDTGLAFGFKEKTRKDDQVFTDSVDRLQVEDLEKNLERYAKYLEEIIFELKYNEKIKEASVAAALLKKPYTDKINFYKGKTRELNKFIDDGVADKIALKSALVEYNKLTARETFKRDQDPALKIAKDILADLKAGFNNSKKSVEIKIKYINILILELDPEQGFENDQDRLEAIEDRGNNPELNSGS